MRFGYTILYVRDVAATLDFYERAFGQQRRFLHESGEYGELETGPTTLAFATHGLAALNLPDVFRPAQASSAAPAFEVCFVTDDVAGAFERALATGAVEASAPRIKPWGQEVAYVRDLDGNLVELASPVA
jgi:catechol 2,3-dioxygenase-like lactoylglutathione lyase family enzyme